MTALKTGISGENRRVFYMDFIRALAMLLIVTYHFNIEAMSRVQDFSCRPVLFLNYHQVNGGTLGVSLFFILSGAALMLSARKEQTMARYLKKRFLAIFPSYWLVWLAGTLATLLLMRSHYEGIPLWTLLLTAIGMDGYLYELVPNFYLTGEWFIGCILLLYLLFPWLKKAVDKAPAFTAAVALAVWAFLLVFRPFALQTDHVFLMRVPEFMLGMYLIRYMPEINWKAGACGLAAALALMFLPDFWGEAEVVRSALMGAGWYLFLGWAGTLVSSFRISGVFAWLSRYSYEWFLLHHMFYTFLFTLLAGKIFGQGSFILLFLLSLLVFAVGGIVLKAVTAAVVKIFRKRPA